MGRCGWIDQAMVVQPPPPPLVPCPLSAGWDKVAEVRLPRLDGAGRPSGGFSAAAYRAALALTTADAERRYLTRRLAETETDDPET